jgi:pentose-5-phosphate-3-epimerase
MSMIVPTITAYDIHEYRAQMEQAASFATRIHIDLMDGIFAPTKSPDIDKLWLPSGVVCDIHIMYQHPFHQLRKLLDLSPRLVIVQAEADKESVDEFIKHVRKTKVGVGISLLAETSPLNTRVSELIKKCQYVLIFSGHLGYQGSKADLSLLNKVEQIKQLNPKAEIGWDGGISKENILELVSAGIDVLNVGGAIQKTADPASSYAALKEILDKHC